MPFITLQTNVVISPEQEIALKSGLSKAIECVPHKSEQSLMIALFDNAKLYLRGDSNPPMAYIRIAVFANRHHLGYDELSRQVTALLGKILSMPSENIFIEYADIPAWAVAGQTFGEPQ